jgi:tetratricopeptide (TPR) repeat protein
MFFLSLIAILCCSALQDSVAVGGYAIQGFVISEVATKSASGIEVLLFKSDGTTVGQTRTDDTGKFRFRGLTKGSYEVVLRLEAAPLRERVAMNTQNQIYEVQFYLRPEMPPSHSGGSTVNLAYLRLPRSVRSEFDDAVRWSGEGKHEKSVASLKKVLSKRPDFAPAYNQLGIDLYYLGRREDAGHAFRRACELAPDSPHAFVNLGKLLNEAGDHLGAIEPLKTGVTKDPQSSLGFFQLGVAYYHLNSLQVAESYLRRALELDGEHLFPIRLELANLYLKRGQTQLATDQLRAFLIDSPSSPQVPQVRQTLEKLAAAPPKP